jgi:hypothetical protein
MSTLDALLLGMVIMSVIAMILLGGRNNNPYR